MATSSICPAGKTNLNKQETVGKFNLFYIQDSQRKTADYTKFDLSLRIYRIPAASSIVKQSLVDAWKEEEIRTMEDLPYAHDDSSIRQDSVGEVNDLR